MVDSFFCGLYPIGPSLSYNNPGFGVTPLRIARWAVWLVPVLLTALLLYGYTQMQSVRGDIEQARHTLDSARTSITTAADDLRGVRDELTQARTRIDSIRIQIEALDQQVAGRVQQLDARIGRLRSSIERVDDRLIRQMNILRSDSVSAPVFIESDR
jgi:septal ring factor EnvC (AmiA/AmiB activator)